MKLLPICILFIFVNSCAHSKEPATYTGSTPANAVVKAFLGIPLKDSIDFIRWKLVVNDNRYELQCQYGISKAGTNGFVEKKLAAFSGAIKKEGNYYHFVNGSREMILLKINANLFHIVDGNKSMLIGNGGWSYMLNHTAPVKSTELSIHFNEKDAGRPMAFEGRTPCSGLSKRPQCQKMKWYFVFYSDSITGKPSYYLEGSRIERQESKYKGRWEVIAGKEGRVIFKLAPTTTADPIYLVRAGENILYFTDAQGNLLVGDEDFSYTLNRRSDE